MRRDTKRIFQIGIAGLLLQIQIITYACERPAEKDILRLPQLKEDFPLELKDLFEYRTLPDKQLGESGHWIHVTARSPVMGVLIWKPCGAAIFDPISTGGFVDWRSVQLADKQGLALTAEGFGTGYEVKELMWIMLTRKKIYRVFEGRIMQRESGEREIITRTNISSLDSSRRWEQRTVTTVDGLVKKVERKQLCLSSNKLDETMAVKICND